MAAGEHSKGASCYTGSMGGDVDATCQTGNDDESSLAELACQSLRDLDAGS
jgi:hypothetical protein